MNVVLQGNYCELFGCWQHFSPNFPRINFRRFNEIPLFGCWCGIHILQLVCYFSWFCCKKKQSYEKQNGEIKQQTFVCYKQGQKGEKVIVSISRKCAPKVYVRCGCEAKYRVHIEAKSGRWYMKFLHDAHNHKLLDGQFMGMLPTQKNDRL